MLYELRKQQIEEENAFKTTMYSRNRNLLN